MKISIHGETVVILRRGPGGRGNMGKEIHHILRSNDKPSVHNIYFSCSIVLKFCIPFDSVAIVHCAEFDNHYNDVIMGTIASQITSLTIVYSTVYSDADQRKHQSSTSLAFVRGIHRGPVNSPHKWPVTRKIFSFDDIIMTDRNNGKYVLDKGDFAICKPSIRFGLLSKIATAQGGYIWISSIC